MRKAAAVLTFVIALILAPTAPSHAQGHGGGGHGGGSHGGGWHGGGGHGGGWHGGGWHGGGWHGGGWQGGGWQGGGWHGGGWYGGLFIGAPWLYPYPYWYSYPYLYPYGDYPGSYYADPPAGIGAPSSVYIQQEPAYTQQEPASSAAPPQKYWYYCASAKAYYPKAKNCREAWIKVPPPPD